MNGDNANDIAEQNRRSWNMNAAAYDALVHSEMFLGRALDAPQKAFHAEMWPLIRAAFPDFSGIRVCVPSSGDNLAVFAFAMLGARVTSCDISENQLENAERIARKYNWGKQIEFVRADTMKLSGVPDDTYDFAYTSNGVHVWINDLNAMYKNIQHIMKWGALYVMFDIHPGQRPFKDDLTVIKPYDMTGPFSDGEETTFTWRTMDIVNAMADAGLTLTQMKEMYAEKSYEWPFWLSLKELENGATASRDEVDRMYDWRSNPIMALPNWLGISARA